MIKLFEKFAIWVGGMAVDYSYYCDGCEEKINKYYMKEKVGNKNNLYCAKCAEKKINKELGNGREEKR